MAYTEIDDSQKAVEMMEEQTYQGNTISGAKGITFNGETFIVPETQDMVKTLFDPSVRKSYCERMILVMLAGNGLVFWATGSNELRIKIFIGLYIFWRLSYNFGIGYLLYQQSNHHKLSGWARKLKLFDGSSSSILSKLAKRELQSQLGSTFDVLKYPIDFNTWLLFRKVVDLILMLDFTTFICLVVVCAMNRDYQFINTDQQSLFLIITRLTIGLLLILFNLWVKVNAHNTIKDYAWYWGDFFFRQINNEELIFDGVFEMVPHPMYSVGYVGYYGFALISKSYTVLVVALFGHFLQMIFLHYIENPHIDKIYGPSGNEADAAKLTKLKDLKHFDNMKPLVGLWNFNWLRASDLSNLILAVTYTFIIPYFISFIDEIHIFSKVFTPGYVLFGIAISFKVFESLLIDILLILQCYYKTFTKWFLYNNIPIEKSLNNWSVIYNSLISLTYSTLLGWNIHLVLDGSQSEHLFLIDWFYLRVFIGLILITTQIWINTSIIDLIGYFGWFYGDFFIPRSQAPQTVHLTKAGVYRYLNNPEQLFGVCGIMGITTINPTMENLTFCFLWVVNNFIRINFIEKPHMIKVYGEQEVLKDSGVTKTFKKHLIPEAIQKRISNSTEKSPNLLDQYRRKNSILSGAAESLDSFIKELKKTNTRLTNQNILELSQNLFFENSGYKLEVKNLISATTSAAKFIYLGTPIEIEWNAPEGHSSKDWIGLYKTTQTSYSKVKTLLSSVGRWVWVEQEQGSVLFDGERLFWEEGIYEFRYHLDGKHDVAYISEPFEIRPKMLKVPDSFKDSDKLALELKDNVLSKVLGPIESIDVPFGSIVQQADNIIDTYNRLAYMVTSSTGIKINTKIFLYADEENDLTINKLSTKIIEIKRVLDELSYDKIDIPKTKKDE